MPGARLSGCKNCDIAVHKFFAIREQMRVEFRSEFFNAFHHPVFSQPDNVVTDGRAAGIITSTVIPQRQIQFALKLEF
jgi:hypothetical protein